MITKKELEFATNALSEAETMLGVLVTNIVTEGAPTPKAMLMAQLLVTTGLLTKLARSRDNIGDNFSSSFDSLVQQLEELWAAGEADGEVDLGQIVFPDALDDYINLAQQREPTETMQ